MSDILREIDEDLRRDRYQKLFERYGIYLIAVAVLIVASVAAWRGWEWYQQRESIKSSARYEEAVRIAQEGKRFDAEKIFNDLAKDGTPGYRLLARFRAAAEAARSDRAAGTRAFDAIAADSSVSPLLRDLAKVHAGLTLLDTAPLSDITARLEPLNTPTGAFRHSAREILGFAHYKAGDNAGAAKYFQLIQTDAEVPPGIRERAQMMSSLVSGVSASQTPATQ
jgi:hypothetical protein